MPGIVIEKSKNICSFEQPVTTLYLISQGRVEVQCPGGSYQIGIGDVAGICEICSEIHFLTYTAMEDTTLMPYPLTSLEALGNLMQMRPEIAKLFLLSLLRPGHGYGMMQRIRELSGGRLVMGPGTLYGVLSRMNREGLIVLTGEDGRRKNYAITEAGKNALLLEYRRLKQLVEDGAILEEGDI